MTSDTRAHRAAALAGACRAPATSGLHCSIGIGDTLARAKNATDLGNPRGVFQLTHIGRLGRGEGRTRVDDTSPGVTHAAPSPSGRWPWCP